MSGTKRVATLSARPRRPSALDGNQIHDLIQQDIEWHLTHPATNLSQEFQDGFVAGLQQAITKIDLAEAAVRNQLEGAMQRFMEPRATRTDRALTGRGTR